MATIDNFQRESRNIFSFSQTKQGKGIFATNERYRMDISYRLANPSYKLVQTIPMKYLNMDHPKQFRVDF